MTENNPESESKEPPKDPPAWDEVMRIADLAVEALGRDTLEGIQSYDLEIDTFEKPKRNLIRICTPANATEAEPTTLEVYDPFGKQITFIRNLFADRRDSLSKQLAKYRESKEQEADHLKAELIESLSKHFKFSRKEKWQQIFDEELYGELKILQLELMPKNLLADATNNLPDYLVGTGPENKDVSNQASPGIWDSLQRCLKNPHKSQLESFEHLLERVSRYAPDFYDDWLEGFNLSRRAQSELDQDQGGAPQFVRDAIVIEDGEFTLFTLLWVFRYANAHARNAWKNRENETNQEKTENEISQASLIEWLNAKSERELPLQFKPAVSPDKANQHHLWWKDISVTDFSTLLGFQTKAGGGESSKDRFKSFFSWLERQQAYALAIEGESANTFFDLRNDPTEIDTNELALRLRPYLPILPIKNVYPLNDISIAKDEDREFWQQALCWLHSLVGFFRSSELEDLIAEFVDGTPLHCIREFAVPADGTFLEKLICDPDKTIDITKTEGDHDHLLTRISRLGYLPMEILLHQWVAEPMQLLILPLDFVPQEDKTKDDPARKLLPTSLTFATIQGSLPEGAHAALRWHRASRELTESSAEELSYEKATEWLRPYYTILNRINHDFTTEMMRDQTKNLTALANSDQFGHEVSYIIGSLRENWSRKISDYFDLPSHSISPIEDTDSPVKLGRLYRPPQSWFSRYIITEQIAHLTVDEYLRSRGSNEKYDEQSKLTLDQYFSEQGQNTWSSLHELVLDDFCTTASVIPDTRPYNSALNFLTSWSSPHNVKDLLPGTIRTIEDLINAVWNFAVDAMQCHASRSMSFSAESIWDSRQKMNHLRSLHAAPSIEATHSLLMLDATILREASFTGLTRLLLTLTREHCEHAAPLTSPNFRLITSRNNALIFEQRSQRQNKERLVKGKYPSVLERIKSKIAALDSGSIKPSPEEVYKDIMLMLLRNKQAIKSKSSSGLGMRIIEQSIKQIDPKAELLYRDEDPNDPAVFLTRISFPKFLNILEEDSQ